MSINVTSKQQVTDMWTGVVQGGIIVAVDSVHRHSSIEQLFCSTIISHALHNRNYRQKRYHHSNLRHHWHNQSKCANTLISSINLCTIMRIRPHSLANNWFDWFTSNKEQCSFQVSSSDFHLSGQYSRLGLVAHGSLSHRRTFEHCWYQVVVLVAVVVVVKSYIFGHSYSKHGHKHAKVDSYALRKSSLLSRCWTEATDSWSSQSNAGREFHVAGPATAKLQGPQQTVFVAGTTRSPCAAKFFYRPMAFQSPNQQCQSTEGNWI